MTNTFPRQPRTGTRISLRLFRIARSLLFCLSSSVLTAAGANGQALGLTRAQDLLTMDPGDFALLLEASRPRPLPAEIRARILSTLPRDGEVRGLSADSRRKLSALNEFLRAAGYGATYEIKVIEAPLPRIGLHLRTVLLISETALIMLNANELRALVAHEIGHEYLTIEYQEAVTGRDRARLKDLELLCDGIAIVILDGLGMDPSRLMTGVEKITRYSWRFHSETFDEENYPSLPARQAFARAVGKWVRSSTSSSMKR